MIERPWLSMVVITYNMHRELPRTLYSLSTAYQRDLVSDNYEVIVVDNGSSPGVRAVDVEGFGRQFRLLTVERPSASPVAAVNSVLREVDGALVGVIFDGARMLSPGALASLHRASQVSSRPFATILGWHLGPDLQSRSMLSGYTREREDEILAMIAWPSNGYDLFGVSSLEGSNASGWFGPLAESTCFVTTPPVLADLGYFDERFRSAGGGLVNHDLLSRVVQRDDVDMVVALGEGTFHQIHGGVSTNGATNRWTEFAAEYEAITGVRYQLPVMDPLYVGRVPTEALQWIGAADDVRRLNHGIDSLQSHANALEDQNAKLAARAAQLAEENLLLRWPSVAGADVVTGTTGFLDDQFVEPIAILRFVALRDADGLTLEGWTPDAIDGDRTLEVCIEGQVHVFPLPKGLFILDVPCRVSAAQELTVQLRSGWEFSAALLADGDVRSLSWRIVGAVLHSVATPARPT